MDATEAWLRLRSTLADTQGPATAENKRRRALYVACIQQFEQLVVAARATAPHSRPIPLYYAAMHAAKALVAAFGSEERPTGHGLGQAREAASDVMMFAIEPRGTSSVLAALADITGSGLVEARVVLADLFLSLPDLCEKPHRLQGPRALYVEEVPEDRSLYPVTDPTLHVLIETEETLSEPLWTTYPTSKGWNCETPGGGRINSRRHLAPQFGREVPFVERYAALEGLAPTYRLGQRWLFPKIAGTTGVLSPLVSWYALLFGFSILARYEPETWFAALDVRQPHAVAIEAALEEATTALPELVWKQIMNHVAQRRLRDDS